LCVCGFFFFFSSAFCYVILSWDKHESNNSCLNHHFLFGFVNGGRDG
jgi:hypothetical protein